MNFCVFVAENRLITTTKKMRFDTCKQIQLLVCLACLVTFRHGDETVPAQEHPRLLLVSFDGFRWDYLKKNTLENFNFLKTVGSHADYIYNSFATVTFPNHWSLVTGLHEESHGIIQNSMYDSVLNKTFSYTSDDSQTYEWFGQNKLAEPIWITNQRGGANRRSAAEWVGSNVAFGDQKPIHIAYNHTMPYNDYIDTFIGMFANKSDPINFGALYFDEPGEENRKFVVFLKVVARLQ